MSDGEELCNTFELNNENEDSYLYWHGDIEEDYDMGDYTCLCKDCFGTLNKQGKIKWNEKRSNDNR